MRNFLFLWGNKAIKINNKKIKYLAGKDKCNGGVGQFKYLLKI